MHKPLPRFQKYVKKQIHCHCQLEPEIANGSQTYFTSESTETFTVYFMVAK